MNTIIQIIFGIIAGILYILARVTGLSYIEVNIIVYYILIPMSWIVMVDAIFKFHYLKIISALGYTVFLVSIKDFSGFCTWLFQKSVLLLNYPNTVRVDNITATNIPSTIVGSTYITNSVIICVLVPVVVYLILLSVLIIRKKKVK